MKIGILVATVLLMAAFASSAAAATTYPGYYWSSARMTAAVHLNVWSSLAVVGLRCEDQGKGACNFTLTCRGLAASPISTPAVRDVLKAGGQVRFRYFHCIVASPCLLNGSWWQDYQTRTDAPQSLASDARHIRQLGNLAPRASATGC
jgi:hypothetical protein